LSSKRNPYSCEKPMWRVPYVTSTTSYFELPKCNPSPRTESEGLSIALPLDRMGVAAKSDGEVARFGETVACCRLEIGQHPSATIGNRASGCPIPVVLPGRGAGQTRTSTR
jgi:hypothetical protein